MRQLAAIMFTDLAGYTAAMEADESRAIDQLAISRKIHKDLIAEFEGIFVKEMGDGNLAKFNSALDAVLCAREILKRAEDLDCKIRIGIHLGDVRIENEDLFGDSVNIASRLQALSEPGGILVSDSVFKSIKSNPKISTGIIGDLKLKNVKEPVRTYFIKGGRITTPSKARIRELTGTETIKALAVLPFRGMAGGDQQYFIDGMQDALIGELSQIQSLRVISRTSTLRYKDSDKNIQEIATELGVDAILEATVIRSEDQVQISTQLIKAFPVEEPIWAGTYNKQIKDIFSLFNEVIKDITTKIGTTLTAQESENLKEVHEVDPKAWEAYLKGMFHWEKLKKEDLDKALAYFNQSAEIDPKFAPAYSGIASIWAGRMQMGLVPAKEAIPNMKQNIEKTFELDNSLPDTHFWEATLKVWTDWNWEGGLESFERALELNPNFSLAHAYYAHLLSLLGRIDEALIEMETAIDLDPFNTLTQSMYGMVLNYARQFEKAEEVLNAILLESHNHPVALSTLRSTYHNMGEWDKAFQIFRQSYLENGEKEAVEILDQEFEKNGYHSSLAKIAEWMIQRSNGNFHTPWQIATLFTRANEGDQALYYLEEAYKAHDPNMPYLAIDPIFDILREEEKYLALLKKMKLEIPVLIEI